MPSNPFTYFLTKSLYYLPPANSDEKMTFLRKGLLVSLESPNGKDATEDLTEMFTPGDGSHIDRAFQLMSKPVLTNPKTGVVIDFTNRDACEVLNLAELARLHNDRGQLVHAPQGSMPGPIALEMPFHQWLKKHGCNYSPSAEMKQWDELRGTISDLAPMMQPFLDKEQARVKNEDTLRMAEAIAQELKKDKEPKTKWDRFVLTIEEAKKVENPSDEDLWRWKDKFDEYPKPYFTRYGEKFDINLETIPALAWRNNSKFRRPRSNKIG